MEAFKGIGLLLFRLFMGGRIFLGVWDNVVSSEKMTEFTKFLDGFGVPYPTLSAPLSVYAQLICGLLIVVGLQTRFVAFLMMINFMVAFFVVDRHLTMEEMTPVLAMLFGSFLLIFEGGGRFSLDAVLDRKTKD